MAESKMVERVAKAIEEKLGMWLDDESGDRMDAASASVVAAARAAIAAMREPTEAMIDAGGAVEGVPGFGDEPGDLPEPDEIYQAMIDEALR